MWCVMKDYQLEELHLFMYVPRALITVIMCIVMFHEKLLSITED